MSDNSDIQSLADDLAGRSPWPCRPRKPDTLARKSERERSRKRREKAKQIAQMLALCYKEAMKMNEQKAFARRVEETATDFVILALRRDHRPLLKTLVSHMGDSPRAEKLRFTLSKDN